MPRLPRPISAAPLIALPPLVGYGLRDAPAWAWMWAVALAIFGGCKWLTWAASRAHAPARRHVAYLFAWPGLAADRFLDTESAVTRPAAGEWAFAGAKTLLGVALIVIAARGIDRNPYGFGWVGMIGLVFALHFGTFHLLSCLWRSLGIDAAPLMQNPAASRSVGEFWGRRWNTAFRDLTHAFLFAPLARAVGPRAAVAAGFAFSGLVHEAVITLPARGGWGLPTLYFTAQGAAILFERGRLGRRLRGRTLTLLVTAGLAPLLFPPAFVLRVIAPLFAALKERLP